MKNKLQRFLLFSAIILTTAKPVDIYATEYVSEIGNFIEQFCFMKLEKKLMGLGYTYAMDINNIK